MKKPWIVLAVILALALPGSAPQAEGKTPAQCPYEIDSNAGKGRESYGRRSGRHHAPTQVFRRPPAGFRKLVFESAVYYHRGGVFLLATPWGYREVRPPFGVPFRTLASGASKVRLAGNVYFVCNNTYFVREREGYFVVPRPRSTFLL